MSSSPQKYSEAVAEVNANYQSALACHREALRHRYQMGVNYRRMERVCEARCIDLVVWCSENEADVDLPAARAALEFVELWDEMSEAQREAYLIEDLDRACLQRGAMDES